jgi:hypothetical protein
MALRTDDCDIKDVRFYMNFGGNGDYYANLDEFDESGTWISGLSYRMAMSGGQTSEFSDVREAFVNLFRVLDKHGLNKFPFEDAS